MANTVKVFDFDSTSGGVAVVVVRTPLMGGCVTDGEIDTNIKLLKDDLDAVALRMKAALANHRDKPIF
jgi:hypothetical protein